MKEHWISVTECFRKSLKVSGIFLERAPFCSSPNTLLQEHTRSYTLYNFTLINHIMTMFDHKIFSQQLGHIAVSGCRWLGRGLVVAHTAFPVRRNSLRYKVLYHKLYRQTGRLAVAVNCIGHRLTKCIANCITMITKNWLLRMSSVGKGLRKARSAWQSRCVRFTGHFDCVCTGSCYPRTPGKQRADNTSLVYNQEAHYMRREEAA